MKFTRTALALAGAVALAVGGMAAPAAADIDVQVTGGTTTITTTAKALPKITRAGIVMQGTDGATSEYVTKQGVTRQKFTFQIQNGSNLKLEDDPVTNKEGSVTGGRVLHQGDITFVNTNNGKRVAVGDFVINFNKGKVLATSVNGDPLDDPIAVFLLDVIDPPLTPELNDTTPPTAAKISGVNLLMTRKAASTLNDLLKTKVFAKDLRFGKAVANADIVVPA